jgi:hypothetical protein
MARVKIDRLSLHLSGMSEDEGRRLARLIADGLAASSVPVDSGKIDSVESSAEPRDAKNLQSLSERIVADLVRQVVRAL